MAVNCTCGTDVRLTVSEGSTPCRRFWQLTVGPTSLTSSFSRRVNMRVQCIVLCTATSRHKPADERVGRACQRCSAQTSCNLAGSRANKCREPAHCVMLQLMEAPELLLRGCSLHAGVGGCSEAQAAQAGRPWGQGTQARCGPDLCTTQLLAQVLLGPHPCILDAAHSHAGRWSGI